MLVADVAIIFAVQFGIISLLFFFKKQSRAGNVLLGIVMAILSFQHFMHYLWATSAVYNYTWLLNIDLPLDGCIAPLLYFYIRLMTGEPLRFKPVYILHFWPLLVGVVWYVYYNMQSAAFKAAFIDSAYAKAPAVASIVNILLVIYLAAGYRKLDHFIKSQPTTQWASGYSNLLWLRQFVVILFFINLGAAPLNLVAKFSYIMVGFPVLTGFIVLFIVYKTFNHPEVMSTEIIRRFTRQLEYQREIERVRRQISGDIHDELGAGLTQISMLSELAKMQHANDAALTGHFDKVSSTARNLLDSLKEVVWAINPVHDNSNSLQAFLRKFASNFFEPTDIKMQLDFNEVAGDVPLDPYLRRNIILIVKEACNNIVKHAKANSVVFSCIIENGKLTLSITDDGLGLPAEKPLLSNGLAGIEKRAWEIGGTVEIKSSMGKGTQLLLICPIPGIA